MDNLILQREFTQKTLKSHQAIIRRLHAGGYVYPMKQRENIVDLIAFLSQYPKANVRQSLLNTIIVCRDIAEKPNIKMKQLRIVIAKEAKVDNVKVMNTLGETLIKKDDFKSLLDESYDNKEWIKYILNYLWFNYGVRNQDVDLTFAKTKSAMTDLTKNYLYVKLKQVVFVRNAYKTSATYGKQSHVITDNKFIASCFNQMQLSTSLFNDKLIGNAVRKYLINGMLESHIFKMLIADAVGRKDTDEINLLSASRGTAIETIKEYYDINAVVDVIREN
mgnify:FL=1